MAKTNRTPENAPIDLLSILSQPVEVENNAPVFDHVDDVEDAEFEEPIDEVTPENDPEDQQPENAQYADEPTFLNARDTAEDLVDGLDALQTFGIPEFLKKRVFTGKEIEMIETLDTSGLVIYPENSPEKKLLTRYLKYQAIADKFPFTDHERNKLVNSTARFVKNQNIQLTPLQGLMASFIGVTTKRLSLFATKI